MYNCVNIVHAIKAGILYRIYIKHNSGNYMYVYIQMKSRLGKRVKGGGGGVGKSKAGLETVVVRHHAIPRPNNE